MQLCKAALHGSAPNVAPTPSPNGAACLVAKVANRSLARSLALSLSLSLSLSVSRSLTLSLSLATYLTGYETSSSFVKICCTGVVSQELIHSRVNRVKFSLSASLVQRAKPSVLPTRGRAFCLDGVSAGTVLRSHSADNQARPVATSSCRRGAPVALSEPGALASVLYSSRH